jgi:hypothetical protein
MNDTPNDADELDELDAGRVRFGSAPGNTIPADWAQPLLRRLHDRHPEAFGRVLMELYAEIRLGQAWTVTRPRQRRG